MGTTRRDWLATAATAGISALAVVQTRASAPDRLADEPFGYCLNTSTISGQKLSIVDEIKIASEAGYHAIEPWIRELDEYTSKGGSLKDLGKRVHDSGLSVESVIGFFEWAVEDDARRRKGLDEAKRNIEMVHAIGGKRIAAPPVGATDHAITNLEPLAQRYRELLELGETLGVAAEVELWGFSKTLHRLGEVAYVAIEAQHPSACVLLDVFHLYKGGSDLRGVRMLSGSSLHVFHFNDYPQEPRRDRIDDSRRVYPGDGVAPLGDLVRDLYEIGFRGFLSLELFNREYWKQDATAVARQGLAKMRGVVREAMKKART